MMTILAEIATHDPDLISGKTLIAILGGIGSLFGTGFLAHRMGRSQSVKISDQPVAVKMEDHFVTRREFEHLEGRIKADVTEMKGLFARTMEKFETVTTQTNEKIEERDKALSSKIESIAAGAYEARRRIHEKVNVHGERLKSVEDRMPVRRQSAG